MRTMAGILFGLTFAALGVAFLWYTWRPLPPWLSAEPDPGSSWWTTPLQVTAWILFGAGALAAVVSIALAADDSGSEGLFKGVALSLTVSVPYVLGALALAAVSGTSPTPPPGWRSSVAEASGEPNPSIATQPPMLGEFKVSTLAEAQTRLTEVRDQLGTTLRPALLRLGQDTDALKARLRAAGVKGSSDLDGNPRAQVLAQELAEVIRYREAVRRSIDSHVSTEFQLESIVRRLERAEAMESIGLPEGELLRMATTLRILDGRLADRAGQPKEITAAELDALIDAEMAATAAVDPKRTP